MKHVKIAGAALILGALGCGQAFAQAPAAKPAASAPAAQPEKLSSDSLVGDILDNPAAKAVLIKHIPDIGKDDQIEQARGMTLRSLQDYAPEAFTDKVLAAIDADLAKVPTKPQAAAK